MMSSSLTSSHTFTYASPSSKPSLAQSKFTLIAEVAPKKSRCNYARREAKVVLPDPLGPIMKTAFIPIKMMG